MNNRPELPPLPIEGARFERQPITPGLDCETAVQPPRIDPRTGDAADMAERIRDYFAKP